MSHYSIGSSVYTHKGKPIRSIVGDPSADKFISRTNFDEQSKPGIVPAGYAFRPDMISSVFLDNPKDLWFICLISNKFDPFEDFNIGERIRLPK